MVHKWFHNHSDFQSTYSIINITLFCGIMKEFLFLLLHLCETAWANLLDWRLPWEQFLGPTMVTGLETCEAAWLMIDSGGGGSTIQKAITYICSWQSNDQASSEKCVTFFWLNMLWKIGVSDRSSVKQVLFSITSVTSTCNTDKHYFAWILKFSTLLLYP